MRKFHYNSFFCCIFRICSVHRKDDSYMANYCYTNLYVYGPQEELANLFKKLKRWTRKDERKPKTAFGCGWLGFIAEGAGIKAFDLRAGVEKFQFDGKEMLYICYTSAWEPQAEFWKAVLRKFAPACKSYYLSEESCQGLYVTNDKFRRVITADYAIPAWDSAAGCYLPSELRRSTFYTEEAMRELLSSRYGSGKSTTELLELARHDGLPVYEVKREA